MHHGAGRVGLLQRSFRCRESGIHAGIVDNKRAGASVGDQIGCMPLQILFGDIAPRPPSTPFDLHQIGGTARCT